MNPRAVLMVLLLASAVAAAPGNAQLDEYERRREELTRQLAADHYALGKWCQEQKLSNEAKEHFRRALLLQPGHTGSETELRQLDTPTSGGKRVRCEVWLKSGAHVRAELLAETFRAETGSGLIALPIGKVDVVKVDKGPFPDVIVSAGFCGRARLRDECFVAKTKVGVLTLRRAELDRIRILRPCTSCDGKATVSCPTCKKKGRLYEQVTCEQCEGAGKIQCLRCEAHGRRTCPKCEGEGWTYGNFAGMNARFKCGRCDGRGVIDCPSCRKGMARCGVCKGRPLIKDMGPCPDCDAKKLVPCKTCKETGVKPFSAEAEKEVKKWLGPATENREPE